MNYALEARVEIALYRVLLDINPSQAWHHYERAQEAAAMAYDSGQADSLLLATETYLVASGRLARDARSPPLATNFADWLAPLHRAVPSAGIGPWAEAVDGLSLRQLIEVGDDAADFTASMRYEDLHQAASLALGDIWRDSVKTALKRAQEFSDSACRRAVVELEFCGWRIQNIGYAAIGAVAERVLAALRPGRMPQGAMWFSDIFTHCSNGEI